MTAAPTPAPAPTSTATPTPTPLLCPACGAAAVPGDRFCEACGTDLPFSEAVETAPAPEPEYAADVPEAGEPCASCGADANQIQDGYCGVCGMKQPLPRDHLEVSYDGVAAVTDRGRRHRRNEDAYALHVADDGSRVIAIVCDGVSTTVDPDAASQAAADAALAVLMGDGNLLDAHASAQAAAVAVTDQPPPPDLGWPSCTFLAGVVRGAAVELATMGDCRTFWLPEAGEPATLTEDDSWAAEKIAAGALTPEEAYAHPLSHTITRWLGRDADPSWTPRVIRFHADGPGRLILCSDGLWNYAQSAADVAGAAGLAASEGDPLSVARRLVSFANESGGHDNITAIVVDLKGNPS